MKALKQNYEWKILDLLITVANGALFFLPQKYKIPTKILIDVSEEVEKNYKK